jgi:hypothetical protein
VGVRGLRLPAARLSNFYRTFSLILDGSANSDGYFCSRGTGQTKESTHFYNLHTDKRANTKKNPAVLEF